MSVDFEKEPEGQGGAGGAAGAGGGGEVGGAGGQGATGGQGGEAATGPTGPGPSNDPNEDAGCGCTTPGNDGAGWLGRVALLVALGVGLARRRRSRR